MGWVGPLRTGLYNGASAGRLARGAPRLTYFSWDIATMARVVRGLVGGGYQVDKLYAFDLFPNTPHVEMVLVLSRG